jgi:F0F1-type ATP synthase delta subunit
MKLTPRYYATKLIAACFNNPKNIKQEVDNFWQTVLANKHFSWRKRIVQEIDGVWQGLTGRDQVKIWSARELTTTEKQSLVKTLHKKIDKEAEFEWFVKPHIMGGIVMTVNDERFDLSVKGRLDSLYYNLIK